MNAFTRIARNGLFSSHLVVDIRRADEILVEEFGIFGFSRRCLTPACLCLSGAVG